MVEDKPAPKRYEKKFDHKKKHNNKLSRPMELTPPSRKRKIILSMESQVIMYLSADIRPKMTTLIRQIQLKGKIPLL